MLGGSLHGVIGTTCRTHQRDYIYTMSQNLKGKTTWETTVWSLVLFTSDSTDGQSHMRYLPRNSIGCQSGADRVRCQLHAVIVYSSTFSLPRCSCLHLHFLILRVEIRTWEQCYIAKSHAGGTRFIKSQSESRRRWEDNNKIVLKEKGFAGVD
jgi:hypothetical protein